MREPLQARLRALATRAPGVGRELAGASGAAAFAYGAWLANHAAGFMVGGVLLIAGAIAWPKGKAG